MTLLLAQIADSVVTGGVVAGVFIGVKITEHLLARRNGRDPGDRKLAEGDVTRIAAAVRTATHAEDSYRILTGHDQDGQLLVYSFRPELRKIVELLNTVAARLEQVVIEIRRQNGGNVQ